MQSKCMVLDVCGSLEMVIALCAANIPDSGSDIRKIECANHECK